MCKYSQLDGPFKGLSEYPEYDTTPLHSMGCQNILSMIQPHRQLFNYVCIVLRNIGHIFYSILFHNSEVWYLPSVKANLKQKLLSASAHALKVHWKKLGKKIYHLILSIKCPKEQPRSIYEIQTCIMLSQTLQFPV